MGKIVHIQWLDTSTNPTTRAVQRMLTEGVWEDVQPVTGNSGLITDELPEGYTGIVSYRVRTTKVEFGNQTELLSTINDITIT